MELLGRDQWKGIGAIAGTTSLVFGIFRATELPVVWQVFGFPATDVILIFTIACSIFPGFRGGVASKVRSAMELIRENTKASLITATQILVWGLFQSRISSQWQMVFFPLFIIMILLPSIWMLRSKTRYVKVMAFDPEGEGYEALVRIDADDNQILGYLVNEMRLPLADQKGNQIKYRIDASELRILRDSVRVRVQRQ